MTRYRRPSNTDGVQVEWKPDYPIPDGAGGEIHPAHARASALVNVLGVAKSKVTNPDYVADVDQSTARSIREEYERLEDNPGQIQKDIVTV